MASQSGLSDQWSVYSYMRPISDSFSQSDGDKNSCKRNSDEYLDRASKRSRTEEGPSFESLSIDSDFKAAESIPPARSDPPLIILSSSNDEGQRSNKRKSEETEGPRKRSRPTPGPSETPSNQANSDVASHNKPGTSTSRTIICLDRADFEARYVEEEGLGEGGFGSVFAGYRTIDNLPVAIKHISQHHVKHVMTTLDGKFQKLPLEVALMRKVNPSASSNSVAIALLDWYDLDDELILILERPVPCMDLVDYTLATDSPMPESEAKIITKQLVDALLEIQSRGVFHKDFKLQNILVETASENPRTRIIDFGCGTFFSEGLYTTAQGTVLYTSPEWFLKGSYRAEPATVWQLGVSLYTMINKCYPFKHSDEIIDEEPYLSWRQLSTNCEDFILSCLEKNPENRPSLETLRNHPWLQ